jgi:ubiquinone/menaquinone biosynthesis C-methylase UbiE
MLITDDMHVNNPLSYHLMELDIAQSPSDPRFIMPQIPPDARVVLDLGCGIGQTLLALLPGLGPSCLLIGIDVDQQAAAYGSRLSSAIHLLVARGEQIPLTDGSVDFVISRVSLPYTHVKPALGELHRVLKPGGYAWFALHPRSMHSAKLREEWRAGHWKSVLKTLYVFANTALLSVCGVQISLPDGRTETFQTPRLMRRLLKETGLDPSRIDDTGPFVVEARRL